MMTWPVWWAFAQRNVSDAVGETEPLRTHSRRRIKGRTSVVPPRPAEYAVVVPARDHPIGPIAAPLLVLWGLSACHRRRPQTVIQSSSSPTSGDGGVVGAAGAC